MNLDRVQRGLVAGVAATCLVSIFAAEIFLALAAATYLTRLVRGATRLERLPLDGPLLPADWTVELNYLANTDGSMTLSLTQGPDVKVPVHPGLNRVYVRLPGAGDAITARADTAALSLCIASGPVGFLAPAA